MQKQFDAPCKGEVKQIRDLCSVYDFDKIESNRKIGKSSNLEFADEVKTHPSFSLNLELNNAQAEAFYCEYYALKAEIDKQFFSLNSEDKKICFSCDCPTIMAVNHLKDTEDLYVKDGKEANRNVYVRFATPVIVNRFINSDCDLYKQYCDYVNIYHFFETINKRYESFVPYDFVGKNRCSRFSFYNELKQKGYPSKSLKKLWKGLKLYSFFAKGNLHVDLCKITLDRVFEICGINQEYCRFFAHQLATRYYYKTKNGHYKPYFTLMPCGHCLVCRSLRSNDLAQRSVLESQLYSLPPLMITLTYDNDSLRDKANYSLSKKHIDDFLKRLRNHIGYEFYRDLVKYVPMYNAEHPEDEISTDVLDKFSKNSSSHQKIFEEIIKPHKDFVLFYASKCVEETNKTMANKVFWMPQFFLNTDKLSLDGLSSLGVRFLLCGEYGSHTKRAHYHLLLWNYPVVVDGCFSFGGKPSLFRHNRTQTLEEVRNLIVDCWKYGDLGADYIYPNSNKRGKTMDIEFAKNAGGYVTKYLSKQYKVGEVQKYYRTHKSMFNLTDEQVCSLRVEPPFLRWSNGLGYVNPQANDVVKRMIERFFKSNYNEPYTDYVQHVEDKDGNTKKVTLYNSPSFKYYFNCLERNSTLDAPYRSMFYSHLLSLKEIYSATYPVISYLKQKIAIHKHSIDEYNEYCKITAYRNYFDVLDEYYKYFNCTDGSVKISFYLHEQRLRDALKLIRLTSTDTCITHRSVKSIYYRYRNSLDDSKIEEMLQQYLLLRTRIEKYVAQFGDQIKLPKSYDARSTTRLQTPSVDYLDYLLCKWRANLANGVVPQYDYFKDSFVFDFSKRRDLNPRSFFAKAYKHDKRITNEACRWYIDTPICKRENGRALMPLDMRNQSYIDSFEEGDIFYLPYYKNVDVKDEDGNIIKSWTDYKSHYYEPYIDFQESVCDCYTLGEQYSDYVEHLLQRRRLRYHKSAFFEVHDLNEMKPVLRHKIDASFNGMVTEFVKNANGDNTDCTLYVNDKVDCQKLVNYILDFETDEEFIKAYNQLFDTLDFDVLKHKQVYFDKYCDDTFSKVPIDILCKIKDIHIKVVENTSLDKL